ncbi:Zinc transporter ZIP14 [Wickerhamomyces ciferrii]|uniref:Zinc transporter ZIP14 n=1 Tax=Wickerhamomyces ciferrii (strain ATCC 14091 / BCRC 22168 / CBS 111 / JCM 3599 / NBRC 0793 / NRRL Y-1031 F-60-10) TaxID=1206466 RepID=K0KEL9_WICCF|nr:Zinc transporter ZIP14 [Wickerhamomyces ciferrii]CCH40672.1 Zinc transporter ZIP14 [Wickerhamomyces ciferrii]
MKSIGIITLALLTTLSLGHATHPKNPISNGDEPQPLYYDNGDLNLDSLSSNLESCSIVKELNAQKLKEFEHEQESWIQYVFSKLFPFENPGFNAILATTYISGPPNLILSFIPASINPAKLSLLVSFAIGGLLGDVFLHLLPQTFVGEPVDHTKHSFVLVDEKRNTILGLFIFIGFISFFIIDKGLRILQHQQGEKSNGHSHSHASSSVEQKESDLQLRQHKKTDGDQPQDEPIISNPNSSIKASAYLNLISDFTHNITDGLAISASFYISKNVGSTTCLAVFFHEIPHEVGDFALLIQGGFTKWQAMNSQFVTAIGAYLGTFLGIFIQNLGQSSSSVGEKVLGNVSPGLFGTSVTTGDLTLPFTAGGFLYIATVGVIPEVLELQIENSRKKELINGVLQLIFVFIGISLMFLISWFE